MPSLDINCLSNLKINNLYKKYPTFVETGTCVCETILKMEPLFETLHTVEIKKEFYLNAKAKYNGNKITFHLGDSSVKLKELCNDLKTNTLFFLDGHWSSGNTGRGIKDCPLYEELDSIMKYCLYNSIIIVDDVRLFGKGPNKGTEICNWEDINTEKILNIVNERLENYYFLNSELSENDRLILHIKSK